MTMTEFERLSDKLDAAATEQSRKHHEAKREQTEQFSLIFDKLGALQLDMAVLKSQRTSGEKDVVEMKGRIAMVEHRLAQAALWRAWMMGAGATLGVVGSKVLDWLMGRPGH